MYVKVVTLRYQESAQGFPEAALREATAGREVLEAREHFFVHGNVPHLVESSHPVEPASRGGGNEQVRFRAAGSPACAGRTPSRSYILAKTPAAFVVVHLFLDLI